MHGHASRGDAFDEYKIGLKSSLFFLTVKFCRKNVQFGFRPHLLLLMFFFRRTSSGWRSIYKYCLSNYNEGEEKNV